MKKQKTEKKYLRICEYNRLFIIVQLAKQLKKDGAIILESIYSHKTKLNIQNYFVGNGLCDVSQECKAKIDKNYKSGFFWVCGVCGWLTLDFILNGFYYSFSPNENQFLGGTYTKIKINDDGSYLYNRICKSFEDMNDHEKNIYNGYALASCGMGDNSFKIYSKNQLKRIAKRFYVTYFKDFIINGKPCTQTYKRPMQRTNTINIYERLRKADF